MNTITIVILIAVAFLISLLICLVWRSKMKTAKLARGADNYVPEGGFRLTGSSDVFLYRSVTRTRIQSSQPSSSGSGGGSGRR